MFIESPSPTLLMSAGELARLPAAACATIECVGGSVWITQDGQATDYVLESGQTVELSHGDPVLVQAFEPTLLRVRPRSTGCAQAARGSRGFGRRVLAAIAGRFAAAGRIGGPAPAGGAPS